MEDHNDANGGPNACCAIAFNHADICARTESSLEERKGASVLARTKVSESEGVGGGGREKKGEKRDAEGLLGERGFEKWGHVFSVKLL